jgi:hypothetical protein
MAIYRGAGGAGDATGDSASEALLVRELAAEVTADAAAAEAARVSAVAAKVAAELAETNAETAETNAETAETNAETAQAAAASSASAASTSATNAANSATAAQTAETNAETAETNAETAETNAASSASAASTSASNASTSATNASNSATAAATSATNASNSATAASTSATNASNSATAASTSATNAANSATAAQTAETNAETAETNAETAQTAAELAETNAETAASNAATSETNAAASASAASTSASNASTSATNASNSASAASTSATNASNSASAAATSATNAANSATLAATYTPSQTGNSGKFLTTDGTNTSWGAVTGVVTSVTGTAPVVSSGGTTPAISMAAATTSVNGYLTSTDWNTFNGKYSTGGALGTPSSGTVTNLTGTASININGTVGATTASTGAFTTLSTTGVITQNSTFNSASNFGFKNRIINGAMVIDQRNAGASVTADDGVFIVDRWRMENTQSSKLTGQQNAGSVTPPAGFRNYLGLTSSSAYSVLSGDYFCVDQIIEGFNVFDLGWGTANAQTVTLSFWVRSSLTGTFGGTLANSASNRSYPFTYTISSANTWEQKSVTIAGDTSGTWVTDNGPGLRLRFGLGVGTTYSGTAGAWSGSVLLSATGATSVVGTSGATFYITGVQLEKGSTATSFDYRPYGTELALCQRYYQTIINTGFNSSFAASRGGGANIIDFTVPLIVPIRAAPTITTTGNYTLFGNNANESFSSPTYVGFYQAGVTLRKTGLTTNPSAFYAYLVNDNSVTTQISAEL